jgi:hypothetical protein
MLLKSFLHATLLDYKSVLTVGWPGVGSVMVRLDFSCSLDTLSKVFAITHKTRSCLLYR